MLDDGLPLFGPKIDFYQIKPITPRRTLTFINYFISQTTNFLNKFAATCEERLDEVGLKIQRAEVLLVILETKIASIPGLENVSVETPRTETAIEVEAVDCTAAETPPTAAVAYTESEVANSKEEGVEMSNGVTNRNNPLYKKYFSMLSMGVPAPAIKQKMMMENVDPSVLDNPSVLSQGPQEAADTEDDGDSNYSDGSDSSFDD